MLDDESIRRQLDESMRKEGKHYREAEACSDPSDPALSDVVRDVRELKNRLSKLESMVHKLLESKEKDL